MRIIQLQRRLREIGRIRIGEKVDATNRRGEPVQRPAKIDTFRLTSGDRQVIEAAAKLWGGTAEPWQDAPGGPQWQVRTAAAQIPVVVPPGDMSFSQSFEQWSAGGCKVRCDGQWDHIGDRACHCDPDPAARACKIHTRLSVILPDLPGLGVWRLDTGGYYAAVELGGIVDICAAASTRGVMLPARLLLQHREVKRIVDGKPTTLKFAVPILDIDVHPLALTNSVNTLTGELGPPPVESPPARPALTPAPRPDASLAPSVAQQVAQVNQPPERAPRANGAEPIRPTGLRPRTAQQAAESEPDWRDDQVRPQQLRKIMALFNQVNWSDRADRLHASTKIVGRELTTAKDLTKSEASTLIDTLETVAGQPNPTQALTDLLDGIDAAETVDGEIVDTKQVTQ